QYVVEETQMQDVSSVVPPKENVINKAVEDILQKEDSASVEGEIIAEGFVDESMLPEDAKVLVDGSAEKEAPKETAKNVAASVPSLHFPVEEGLLWPMDGNVIMNYSMDATIYYATLDQYKYNPAIIIAGAVNNKVYSVAKGKIVDISQNEVTGTTVTVDLGDGYQAIYGQLKELNFDVGDYLESGHVIGYVSEPTKYYSVEGSNLYFELQKDGVPIDPIVYFE
ncbi:MAG: peptidoglycan DD-metalloendopeptidase family protein, partial [Roseburia sp.]|nr:peptidoglycan DD-metalloendopeptidase family protein [Roseburia sp.]